MGLGSKGVGGGVDNRRELRWRSPSERAPERGVVGLDIDGRYLAAAQVDSGRLVRGASTELPSGLVRDGEVIDRDGLAEALKNFVGETGLPKRVLLGVANQQIVVRVVELPRIEDEKQRDAAVRFQAAEAIAMPLDEAVLDHQVAGYAEAPDGTPRMQVVLVAARRSMLEALLEAAKKAGLKAEGVDLDAFALVRTLGRASAGRLRRRGPRLLPPRRRDQPGHRRRHRLLLHPAARRGVGRGRRRLAARRRDPAVDRLLHDPAAGPPGRARSCSPGPGSSDAELVDSLGDASRPPHLGGGAARRPRRVGM